MYVIMIKLKNINTGIARNLKSTLIKSNIYYNELFLISCSNSEDQLFWESYILQIRYRQHYSEYCFLNT